MNDKLMLKTEKLYKYFSDSLIINNINIEITEGGITSIIGPNGAGKSTLVNLSTGFLKPTSGKIFFKEKNITTMPIQKRVNIGINRSFQINSLFGNLTVLENILIPLLSEEPLKLKWLTNSLPEIIENRAMELAESINIDNKLDINVDKLSHGEQRMLEITLSIAKKPELLFLDEPTSGLSHAEIKLVMKMIETIADRGATIVLVEHNMDVVFSLSKRIIVLNRGEVLADDGPLSIKSNEEVKKIYFGETANNA